MTVMDNAQAPATPAPASATPLEPPASDPAVQGGNPPAATGDPEHPAATDLADADEDNDQDDGTRTNREKRYRLKLREAERLLTERDELIARTRQAAVNGVVNRAGYTEKVAELVAADMDALLDDNGIIDTDKVTDAIGTVTNEFGITRKARPPAPNHQQGRGSGHPAGKASWAGAIKDS